MKALKSLLALGIALAVSSTAMAETANPLAAVKESATTQAKQAVTSAQNSAKNVVAEKVAATKSTATEKAANVANNAKTAVVNKVAETSNTAQRVVAEKATTAKESMKESATSAKEAVKAKAAQPVVTARETLNTAKMNSETTVKKVAAGKKVNINTASVEELQLLDGIGEVKAKAIVEYRAKNGPFKKSADLANVTGIGNATVEKIKSSISFK